MKRPESPCKDCGDRTLGCHAKCDKFKEYVGLNEQYKAEVKKAKEEYGQIVIKKGKKLWIR